MDSVVLTVAGLLAAGTALLVALVAGLSGPWRHFSRALEVFRAGMERGVAPLRVGIRRHGDASGA